MFPSTLHWYTDGSKTEQGTGVGIFGRRPRTEISVGPSKETEVQAETVAINQERNTNARSSA